MAMHSRNNPRLSALALAGAVLAFGSLPLGAQVPNATGNQLRMGPEAFARAVETGLVEGVRGSWVLRPDLVNVRLDWGIVGGWASEDPSLPQGPFSVADATSFFTIQSGTDPNYRDAVAPSAVHRLTFEGHNWMDRKGFWPLAVHTIRYHDCALSLPHPLQSGHSYTIKVHPERLPEGMSVETTLNYAVEASLTPVIKVNQVSYSAVATQRYAYLGWWIGVDGGAVDFGAWEGGAFEVINEDSGNVDLRGTIVLRARGDVHSGEDVYEMNLSELDRGKYHVRIPGLARSASFHVGGQGSLDLYYHTMRGFLHQRSGQRLGKPYTWAERDAWHLKIAKTGHIVKGTPKGAHGGGEGDHTDYTGPVLEVTGGYYDAADFDSFTYHLPATHHILTVYENLGSNLGDGELDLPESGNGVPDILDEATWGLKAHLALQAPDGSIPLGRIHMCDALPQNFQVEKKDFSVQPPFGLIPPVRSSSAVFAAVAAKYARLIEPYDAQAARKHLEAARRAFEFSIHHKPSQVAEAWNANPENQPRMRVDVAKKGDGSWPSSNAWAALELYKTTGDAQYREWLEANPKAVNYWWGLGMRAVAANTLPEGHQPLSFAQDLKNRFLTQTDKIEARTHEAAYRMGNGKTNSVGWGAAQGANHADNLLHAYFLTGEQKYLDAASLNADFHLGANPLSKCSLTGMGLNPPRRPEINGTLYDYHADDFRGPVVKGIGIYGIGPPQRDDQQRKFPLWRSWRDVWGNFAEIYSEFTLHQTIGPSAMLYSSLFALERERKGLMPGVQKPDPMEQGVIPAW